MEFHIPSLSTVTHAADGVWILMRYKTIAYLLSYSSSTPIFLAVPWYFESWRLRILTCNRGRRGTIVGFEKIHWSKGHHGLRTESRSSKKQPMNSPAKTTGATTMLMEVRLRYSLGVFPLSSPYFSSSTSFRFSSYALLVSMDSVGQVWVVKFVRWCREWRNWGGD